MSSKAFYLHVFRVEEGLGNACLIELPDGRKAIVDWGTQEPAAIEKALDLAPEGFAFIAATHAHQDHVLGIPRLIDATHDRGLPIGFLTFPASTLHKPNAQLTRARRKARELGIPQFTSAVVRIPGASWHPLPLAHDAQKTWSFLLLAPSCTAASSAEIGGLERGVVPGNETSLVLFFRFHGARKGDGWGRALLPGDATPGTFRQARETAAHHRLDLRHQLLLVPHHGSSKNLPDWLLDKLHGVAVVSGRDDSDHHPNRSTLERLSRTCASAEGSRLFCTSYAKSCARIFGRGTGAVYSPWTRQGPCFGHLTIRLPADGPAQAVRWSADGFQRRRFGFCGNVA